MKLAPTNNLSTESKRFAYIGLVASVASLFVYILVIASLPLSLRALILAIRAKNNRLLFVSCTALATSLLTCILYWVGE